MGLTGTKLGCAEGGCGACTVMVSKFNQREKKVEHLSVNACLAPLPSVDGCAVITVEGIGSSKERLHPVQERIAKNNGSQCGFCTPGIVMSMYTLLRNSSQPSCAEIEDYFDGNLCRCTGYRPILEGLRTLSGCCPKGINCCKNGTGNSCDGNNSKSAGNEEDRSVKKLKTTGILPSGYDPTQEFIFPPELMREPYTLPRSKFFKGDRCCWYTPSSLAELLSLKNRYPEAKIVCGNTELGIETKFKGMKYPVFISGTSVQELTGITKTDEAFIVGSSVTLSKLEHYLKTWTDSCKNDSSVNARAILENLKWFAGKQVRNVGVIGGNIATASPISDLNPLLVAMGSKLTLRSETGGERKLAMNEFFISYRKTALKPTEVIVNVSIPFSKPHQFMEAFKQAKRRDDDIAIVNAGMSVSFSQSKDGIVFIEDVCLCFGGVSVKPLVATGTCEALKNMKWCKEVIDVACAKLQEDIALDISTPGGMVEYRRCLCVSFFFKFFMMASKWIERKYSYSDVGMDHDMSATYRPERPLSTGVQDFDTVLADPKGSVGKPITHKSAILQATGEAVYVDDMSLLSNELYGALVFSTEAHAKIKSIDASDALRMPGVQDFICEKDVPCNEFGYGTKKEECFVKDTVTCVGQHIGVIVAETYRQAQEAVKAVKIEYETLTPVITIEDAIEAQSFMHGHHPMLIAKGDIKKGFEQSDDVIEGSFRVGGQEHFYLETMAVRAIPKENDEMELFACTQNPCNTQYEVAKVLDVPVNRVSCRVKRLGGGFGGKETRTFQICIAIAVAAKKTQKPIRCMLDRDEDMISTGQRHPFLFKYKVGFKKDGRICAADIKAYSNAGNFLDLSASVMERTLFHIDNCYKYGSVIVEGFVCKTNLPSNTAFRGFGAPQAMCFAENLIYTIAKSCGLSPEAVREVNMYHRNDLTHHNQRLEDYPIREMWSQLRQSCSFDRRMEEVKEFNSKNKFVKKGISMIPTKFGISFTATHLNQAGALVHCYRDGTVLLSHGGTEMGQGLHTKMIQVAATALGIEESCVYLMETNSMTVANTSPTAASASSDLNGMAIIHACEQINNRLARFKADDPNGEFKDWVTAAYLERVNLSANGFYSTAEISFDWVKYEGTPFSYFTYGVACSEVLIDTLTGDHEPIRTDIIMDLGSSLNPAIDIGQIEGAFVQGLGYCTTEEVVWSQKGVLLSRGPGTYKIPGFKSIPQELNVSLLKNSKNKKAVHSSKAVGEPPFFMGFSVFLAIKEAIASARKDNGESDVFDLNLPATAEKIRMACGDRFAKQFPRAPKDQDKLRWNIEV